MLFLSSLYFCIDSTMYKLKRTERGTRESMITPREAQRNAGEKVPITQSHGVAG